MKIAAALGVWPFWGWKIINHGGWFTQVKGRSWQKSVPHCIVHACMNGLFFLTTELHQKYIKITSLLHHLYITFTSFLQLIRHFHPLCHLYITPFLNVLTAGFPAAPATLHGHAINCVPVHRFRMGRTPETGLTPAEWCEFPRYALVRILMHAVKTEPARFWRVFGWFVACFTGFPSETRWGPLRRCTQQMLW